MILIRFDHNINILFSCY